jgi:hypothetical protein
METIEDLNDKEILQALVTLALDYLVGRVFSHEEVWGGVMEPWKVVYSQ